MKKYLLLLFTLICTGNAIGQSYMGLTDSINAVDNNGLKQGRWIITNKTKKLSNCPETNKVEEGEYKDGKKIAIWKSFYCNGNVKNELTFLNGRPSGYAKFYYESGTVEEEGMWENNRWVGQYKRYHENGQLSQEFKYNAMGTREGTQKYYYDNGKVMIEGDWKDGKEAGLLREYYEDGSIRAEKNFAGGVLDASTTKVYEAQKGSENIATSAKTEKNEVVAKKETAKTEASTTTSKTNETVATTGTTTPVATVKSTTPEKVGIIADGFHKTYTKLKQVEKEGTFKDGILWEGKIFSYDGTRLVKTMIVKNGKTESVVLEK